MEGRDPGAKCSGDRSAGITEYARSRLLRRLRGRNHSRDGRTWAILCRLDHDDHLRGRARSQSLGAPVRSWTESGPGLRRSWLLALLALAFTSARSGRRSRTAENPTGSAVALLDRDPFTRWAQRFTVVGRGVLDFLLLLTGVRWMIRSLVTAALRTLGGDACWGSS